jgi:peroxiredoxin
VVELYALQESLEEMKKMGATLVAIAPQLPENTLAIVEKHELGFDILSDTDNAFTASLGLNFDIPADLCEVYLSFGIDLPACSGIDSWVLPMPARLVIDSGGIVRATDIDPDYTLRPEPDKTLADLRALQS